MGMCTSQCPCEGDEDSIQYKAYMHDTHEDDYNDKGRTKVGSDKIGKEDYSDMVWAKKGQKGFKSVMACLDNGKGQEIEGGVDAQTVPSVEYKMDWIANSIAYLDKSNVQVNSIS